MTIEAPLQADTLTSVTAETAAFDKTSSPLRRRRRLVMCVAAAAALVSAGGVVAATSIRSPAQVAADTQAPTPSVITAPVVQEVLRSTVVLRGTFSDGQTISATPTSVADPSGANAAESLVVTGVFVHAGQQVRAGQPMVEYSGRPVFALPGSIPVYRDLVPGESGKDVAQLQQALQSLGYGVGADASGTFGDGTKAAVTRLYTAMGYAVPQTSQATQSAVQAAQQQVDSLTAQLSATPTGAGTGRTQSDASASGSLASLHTQLAQAEQSLSKAQAQAGPMIPASELVFVPVLPARVVAVPVSVGDPVKGPVVTLARGNMELTGQMDPADQGLVKAGMVATVLSETTGDQATATVAAIGALTTPAQGTSDPDSTGGAYIPLQIRPDSPWAAAFDGQDVRITITAAATAGPVLAVPEAAISSGADAQATISVLGPGGSQRVVPVTTGVSANGMVQVAPLNGSLAAGARVVVGQ
ncbi:HlyD family secretion protein [Streptacidiphilus sp. BW17]|uniref:peptidoglycan-binding protein n=1 Tax=Streptacidiphilus sp. BW17 TaxID=3156274 RepID=UPI00351682AB